MCLLVALLSAVFPTLLFAISVNDGVVTTANLNVRQTPSTSGTILATVSSGTVGNVVGGPTSANGYVWWQVTFGSPFVTGWVVQDFLATVPPGSTVYTDFMLPGWHVLPWSNMSSLTTSTTRRSGSYGIQATASAAYARLYLETTIGFSTSGQQSLRFSFMSPSGNGQNHYVSLYNTSGTPIHYVPVWSYVSGGTLVPGTWYDIVIPIADLQATNQTIGGVVVEIESSGTFYEDEVSFSTTYGSTYWTTPTITSVSASCSPSSVQVNGGSQCTPTVTGTGSFNSAVTWTASAGSINSSGLFVAPSSVPNPAGVTITARSVQDTSKSGTATVTVTPPQLSQASASVFSDATGSGWYIGSWSQVTIDPASDTAYGSSSNGMQVQVATPNYGRVQLIANQGYKFNTTGTNYLSFAVNIGKYENEALYVGLLGSGGSVIQYVELAPYITPNATTHRFEAYQWQTVNIPLSDLVAVNTDVYGIEIQSINPSTFFVDEILFTGVVCNVQ